MAAIWLDMLDVLLLTRLALSALVIPLPRLAMCCWVMVADDVEVELVAEVAVADTRLLCCCVATVVPGTVAAGCCSKLGVTKDGVVTDADGGWGRFPFVTFGEGDGPPVVDTGAESEEVICTSELDDVVEVGVDAGGGRGTLLPATVVDVEVEGNWLWRPNGEAADWGWNYNPIFSKHFNQ